MADSSSPWRRSMHRIYTRRGDRGTTTTRHREALPKDDPRVLAYGSLYELNAHLGLARAALRDIVWDTVPPGWEALAHGLEEIQHRLFYVGRDLSQSRGQPDRDPPETRPEHIRRLEALIDTLAALTPPWRPFTLPTGAVPACHLFVATTVCRRAETLAVALTHTAPVPESVLAWINRLSDLLFVAARYVNAQLHAVDPPLRRPEDGY
jgi:cob(I)alamin adenosyltransferase